MRVALPTQLISLSFFLTVQSKNLDKLKGLFLTIFNSITTHIDPPIFISMQKADSLSFPTVYGSGGLGPSHHK